MEQIISLRVILFCMLSELPVIAYWLYCVPYRMSGAVGVAMVLGEFSVPVRPLISFAPEF